MKPLLRIRRGVGIVLIAAGVLHMGHNLFAVLYASHRLRLYVPPTAWAELSFAHFLFLVLAGLGYLTLSFMREGIFYHEALADYLAGLGGFIVMLWLTDSLIVSRIISPWCSLATGLLLAAYGGGLCRGRPFGFKHES